MTIFFSLETIRKEEPATFSQMFPSLTALRIHVPF